jgi:hypothetical protein
MIDQVIGVKYTDNDVASIDHGQLYAQEPGKELHMEKKTATILKK